MHIAFLSNFRYAHTITWALLLSCLIVAIAATIGRATYNLRGALMAEDGSLALMLLESEENISDTTVLRAGIGTQDILAETQSGPKLFKMKFGSRGWFVQDEIALRESGE